MPIFLGPTNAFALWFGTSYFCVKWNSFVLCTLGQNHIRLGRRSVDAPKRIQSHEPLIKIAFVFRLISNNSSDFLIDHRATKKALVQPKMQPKSFSLNFMQKVVKCGLLHFFVCSGPASLHAPCAAAGWNLRNRFSSPCSFDWWIFSSRLDLLAS